MFGFSGQVELPKPDEQACQDYDNGTDNGPFVRQMVKQKVAPKSQIENKGIGKGAENIGRCIAMGLGQQLMSRPSPEAKAKQQYPVEK